MKNQAIRIKKCAHQAPCNRRNSRYIIITIDTQCDMMRILAVFACVLIKIQPKQLTHCNVQFQQQRIFYCISIQPILLSAYFSHSIALSLSLCFLVGFPTLRQCRERCHVDCCAVSFFSVVFSRAVALF